MTHLESVLKDPISREIREAIELERKLLVIPEIQRQNRECASAAAAYAWLGSMPDALYGQHRREGVMSRYMFSFLYRLWPKTWAPRSLSVINRRHSLIRAAALILIELELIDRDQSDYDQDDLHNR